MSAEFLVLFILLIIAQGVFAYFSFKSFRLGNRERRLSEHKYSGFLWKVESALADIVIAYDDGEPEKIAGAYQNADALYKEIQMARKYLDLPLIDALLTAEEQE